MLGGAPASILDTYQRERHPIGRRVIMQSGAMMHGVTLGPRVARAIRNVVSVAALNIPVAAKQLAGSFSGVTLRYKRSRGQSRLVGTQATMVGLREGRLTELQRTPGFLLVRERGSAGIGADIREAERTDSGPALLVRPDGYIAWSGRTTHGNGDWRAALAEWTGRQGASTPALR